MAEVELDRLDAEKERRGRLAVRGAAGDDRGDLQLLGRQRIFRPLRRRQHRLARRTQLAAGAVGPRLRAESLERLQSGPEQLARLRSLLAAPQAFAVRQLGAAALERRRHVVVQLEGRRELLLELVVGREQAAAASRSGQRRYASRRRRLQLEAFENLGRTIGAPDPAVRLDQIGCPRNEPRLAEPALADDALDRLERHDRRLRVAPAELQQADRRAGGSSRQQQTRRGVGGEALSRAATAVLVAAECRVDAGRGRLGKPQLRVLRRLLEQRDRLVGSGERRHPATDAEVELGKLDQRLRQVTKRAA